MAKYWKNSSINFGRIRINSSRMFTFEALPNIPEVHSIETPCGCTKAEYRDGKLRILYKSGTMPKQSNKNEVSVTKEVHIFYSNGEKDTLSIHGVKSY